MIKNEDRFKIDGAGIVVKKTKSKKKDAAPKK